MEKGCHYIGHIRGLCGSPASTLMNVSIQPLNSLWLHTERGLGLLIFCGLGGRLGGLGENGTKEIKKATNVNIQLGKTLLKPTMGEHKMQMRAPEPPAHGCLMLHLKAFGCLGALTLPTMLGSSHTRITQMHSNHSRDTVRVQETTGPPIGRCHPAKLTRWRGNQGRQMYCSLRKQETSKDDWKG